MTFTQLVDRATKYNPKLWNLDLFCKLIFWFFPTRLALCLCTDVFVFLSMFENCQAALPWNVTITEQIRDWQSSARLHSPTQHCTDRMFYCILRSSGAHSSEGELPRVSLDYELNAYSKRIVLSVLRILQSSIRAKRLAGTKFGNINWQCNSVREWKTKYKSSVSVCVPRIYGNWSYPDVHMLAFVLFGPESLFSLCL